MVEVPAAAVCIDAILRETDFISIGSNDLIQYLVAADRDNPKVAHLCEPLSPAIFKVLQMVLDACQRTGTPGDRSAARWPASPGRSWPSSAWACGGSA